MRLLVLLDVVVVLLVFAPEGSLVPGLAALLASYAAGLHRDRLRPRLLRDLPGLLVVALAATLGSLLADASPTPLVLGPVAYAALVAVRAVAYAIRRRRRPRPAVVVGTDAVGRHLAAVLGSYGLRVVAVVDAPQPAVDDLGVRDVVATGPVDDLEPLVAAGIRVRLVLPVAREHVDGVPVQLLARPHTGRAVDAVVAVAALVAVAPVLAVASLAVRLETGGVLSRQRRLGADGTAYDRLRLRTRRPAVLDTDATSWHVDEPAGPVGRLLQRTGVDELPRLVNVLRGEESFGGRRTSAPAAEVVRVLPAAAGAGEAEVHPRELAR